MNNDKNNNLSLLPQSMANIISMNIFYLTGVPLSDII